MDRKTIIDFLRKYGFRILFLGICLFLLLQKDLSFQLRLKSPVKGKEQQEIPVEVEEKDEEKETLTLKQEPKRTPQQFQLTNPWVPSAPLEEVEPPTPFDGIQPEHVAAFIKRFRHVAEAEERKFGIPARFILAHGLLVSRGGTSSLVRTAHNYFGIPCTPDWKGATENLGKVCKRSYPNAWTSFRDFSYYISTGSRKKLPSFARNNIKTWASQVKKAGFDAIEDYEVRILQLAGEIKADY